MTVTKGTVSSAKGGLICDEVSVAFEGVHALDTVSLGLEQGVILGLIGPNGAGKTTLINVLSGFQKPDSGAVRVGEDDLTGADPTRRVRSGLVRTFQGGRLFGRLTAFENIEVAAVAAGARRRVAAERAATLLERFDLADSSDSLARSLPYGHERRLSLARALACEPRFLLLDEPAAGLDETETDSLTETIAGLMVDFDCGVLVVEHDMRMIFSLCDRIHVLAHGRTIAEGDPATVREHPDVVAEYVGERQDDDAA